MLRFFNSNIKELSTNIHMYIRTCTHIYTQIHADTHIQSYIHTNTHMWIII